MLPLRYDDVAAMLEEQSIHAGAAMLLKAERYAAATRRCYFAADTLRCYAAYSHCCH